MTRDDYVRTDELDDALIPLSIIREQTGWSEATLRRKLAGVPRVRYGGVPGREKAVKFRDIEKLLGG